MAEVSLKCKDCGLLFYSLPEVEQHFLLTSHSHLITFINPEIDLEAGETSVAVKTIDSELPRNVSSGGAHGGVAADAMDVDASGNPASETSVTSVADHNNDPDIDQMPMISAITENEPRQPLTKEEKKQKLLELRERALKKEEEERQARRKEEEELLARRKEEEEAKELAHVLRNLYETHRIEDEKKIKRQIALWKAHEEEEQRRVRELIRQRVEEATKAEIIRLLGLPPQDPAATKSSDPIQEKKMGMLVKRVAITEQMRECLWSIKKTHKDEDARVKRAFQTLLTYAGNVVKNPDEEKYRKIRLANQAFQDRVAGLKGGIEFLELCGFEKSEDGECLYMPRDKLDVKVLNTAGKELQLQIENPQLFV